MDISSLRGVSAYTNTQTTLPVDQKTIQNQNLEAPKIELTKENANAAQKAFEVTITEEAKARMASETNPATSEKQSAPSSSDQDTQNVAKAYGTSQIVNIVA